MTDTAQAVLPSTADPHELVFDANVRTENIEPTKDLVASVKEHGVLQAITVYQDDDGNPVVLYGHRRTLAARLAARTEVPITVVPRPDNLRRLATQLTENDHREGVTHTDRARAYQQMTLEGASAAKVAKLTSRPRREVDAALVVAGNDLAAKAVAEHQLTLEQGAILPEFADDPDAMQQLIDAARTGEWDHTLQQQRDHRRRTQLVAARKRELTEAGVAISSTTYDGTMLRISHLVSPDDDNKAMTVEQHASCPGRAVYVETTWLNPTTEERKQGKRSEEITRDVELCLTPGKYNHQGLYTQSTIKKTTADMDPAERAAAAAERREVIACNRAWKSATTVRQDWLRAFADRPKPPKSAVGLIAQAMLRGGHELRKAMEHRHRFAAELLGHKPAGYGEDHPLLSAVEKASDARATVLTLTLVLAAMEDTLPSDAWRSRDPLVPWYLRYLASEGYTLAPVERKACGEQVTLAEPKDADDAQDELDADDDAQEELDADTTPRVECADADRADET